MPDQPFFTYPERSPLTYPERSPFTLPERTLFPLSAPDAPDGTPYEQPEESHTIRPSSGESKT